MNQMKNVTYMFRIGITCLFYHPFEGFPLEMISHPYHVLDPTYYPQVVILLREGENSKEVLH